MIKCQILLLSFKGNIADLLVVSFLAPLEDYLGLKIATSEDGTVNLRPLVQEVPSLIPGDITSLFQHLSFLCSFKFWIPKAQISKITKYYILIPSILHGGAVPTHTAFVQVALGFVSVYTAVFCPKKNTVLYKQ